MLSETGTSILSAVLTCIGERICAILLQPGNKAETYITSLHNEVLAAMWIIGILSSDESIRVVFHSFLDIQVTGSYIAPNRSQLLTEWWKIGEGEKIGGTFDVQNELIPALQHALEKIYSMKLEIYKCHFIFQIMQCKDHVLSGLDTFISITKLNSASVFPSGLLPELAFLFSFQSVSSFHSYYPALLSTLPLGTTPTPSTRNYLQHAKEGVINSHSQPGHTVWAARQSTMWYSMAIQAESKISTLLENNPPPKFAKVLRP
ncbi:hypothetical protein V8E53_013833 [Lactarius tabidus]